MYINILISQDIMQVNISKPNNANHNIDLNNSNTL